MVDFAVPFCSKNQNFWLKLRFFRNLEGYLFPSKIQANDKTKASNFILSSLKDNIKGVQVFPSPLSLEIRDYSPEIGSDVTGFILSDDFKMTGSIFDKDHLVITKHVDLLDFKTIFQSAREVEELLKTQFSYAFHPKKGFLTSFPEYSGIGLHIEAFVFCPFLEEFPQLDERVVIEPFLNHESFVSVKTKSTQGLDLSSAIQMIIDATGTICKAEEQSQIKALKTDKEQLLDKISKSLALLKGAYQLSFQEACEHLLNVKLGFHLGLLEGLKNDECLKLLQGASKSQLALSLNQKVSQDDWLHERAHWLKTQLEHVFMK